MGALLLIATTALVAAPDPLGAASSTAKKWDIGIGSEATRTGPLCDPETGKIKIPSYLAAVCVRPWKDGADNGGSTYQGVTSDTIKAVAYVATIDMQLNPPGGGQPPTNRSIGANGIAQDAMLDAQQALNGRYENYGRQIEWTFVTASGTDEASSAPTRSGSRRRSRSRWWRTPAGTCSSPSSRRARSWCRSVGRGPRPTTSPSSRTAGRARMPTCSPARGQVARPSGRREAGEVRG